MGSLLFSLLPQKKSACFEVMREIPGAKAVIYFSGRGAYTGQEGHLKAIYEG